MSLRYLTAGESHGSALCGILDGMPAGVEVQQIDFDRLAEKRWAGYGRGKRKSLENDKVEVLSGIVGGKTIGSPISLLIRNQDFACHKSYMDPFDSDNETVRISVPLPGHADLAGAVKFAFEDCRFIRERASARETAIRTALSVPARNFLQALGINFSCMVEAIGGIKAQIDYEKNPDEISALIEANSAAFLTPDSEVCEPWKKLIDECHEKNVSIGGTGAVIFWNLPIGLGSHTQYDRKLDAILASLVMSIPAVKGVEVGRAYDLSQKIGASTDSIKHSSEKGFHRTSNHAGGVEGGMSNGEPLIVRFHMKSLPGAAKSESIDLQTLQSAFPADYRSDTQALQAAAVVAESVVAVEIASQILQMTGGFDLETIIDRLEKIP